MGAILRFQIADYLGLPTEGGGEQNHLMGLGFTTLDESPKAKLDTKAYINHRSVSGVVTGYENSFPYDADLMDDEAVIMALYDVARNQKTGGDAEFSYYRVELFRPVAGQENTFSARKFRVCAVPGETAGAPTEIVSIKGTLNQVGDLVEGTFNTVTRAFTAL